MKIVAPLLPRLPSGREYRVIFMERPLAEILASQRAMLARLGKTGANTTDAKLAQTYLQQLVQVRRLLAQHPDEISCLSVGYAAALKDPAQIAARIGDFLGARLDMDAMINPVAPELRNQQAEAVR